MRISDWSSDVCSSDLKCALADSRVTFDGSVPVEASGARPDLCSLQRLLGGFACRLDTHLPLRERIYELVDDAETIAQADRKSVGSGKSVSVRVDLGGRRHIQKKKKCKTRC